MSNDLRTTDQRLDSMTQMMRYILGGVATGIIGLAVFVGSMLTNFVNRGQKNEDYLQNEVKESLNSHIAVQKEIVAALSAQTMILKEMRDDQRKFPAVASSSK